MAHHQFHDNSDGHSHNLSDVLGLLLAWGASVLVRKQPTQRHTYGLRRSSILVASVGIFINGFTAWLFMSGKERDVNKSCA